MPTVVHCPLCEWSMRPDADGWDLVEALDALARHVEARHPGWAVDVRWVES